MTEQELWTQLVQCPGWEVLKQRAEAYFTTRLSQHVEAAADERDDVAALNKVRQVIAAKKAVEMVLAIPTDELNRLALPTRAETLSRRGGL